MSYYETWMDKSENAVNQQTYVEYINRYYSMEEAAYRKILEAFPDNGQLLEGTAKQMAGKLGFNAATMDIFVGFLDGIKSSLNNGDDLDLENVDDDTEIKLDINYESLYYNMHEAKADWLFKIPAWKKVLSQEKLTEIAREYREANIAHSNKVGRNDPCPCGSGKKYKNCCGRKI